MVIYSETVRCGILHADGAIRNLLPDEEADKWWVPLRSSPTLWPATWLIGNTGTLQMRNLFEKTVSTLDGISHEKGPSHNLFDMSDWPCDIDVWSRKLVATLAEVFRMQHETHGQQF